MNIFMMIVKKLLRPWLFALCGAIMILLSTFIIGHTAFQKEQELLSVNAQIEDTEYQLRRSEDRLVDADNYYRLAAIQRSVVKYGFIQSPELQSQWDEVYAQSLYVAVLIMHDASGSELDDNDIVLFQSLRDEARSGNTAAINELMELLSTYTYQAGEYQAQLIIQKAELETSAYEIRSKILGDRNKALWLQITGLVLLLIKELPQSIWKNKLNDA